MLIKYNIGVEYLWHDMPEGLEIAFKAMELMEKYDTFMVIFIRDTHGIFTFRPQ